MEKIVGPLQMQARKEKDVSIDHILRAAFYAVGCAYYVTQLYLLWQEW